MNFLTKWFDAGARFEKEFARAFLARYGFAELGGGARVDLENSFVEVRGLRAALTRENRLLLTGAPGSGKTSALLHLALTNARRTLAGQPGARLPFYFAARDFNPHALPLAADAVRTLGVNAPREYLASVLASDRALVLIDDLDAMPENERNDWLWQFGGAQIVASARGKIAGVAEFPLPGFRDNDIHEFADIHLREQANAFLAALKANGVPRSLTANPFTVTLLERVWRADAPASAPANELFEAHGIKPLPTRRADLFSAYAHPLLNEGGETAKMLEGVALAIQRGKPAANDFQARARGFLSAGKNQTSVFVHDLWQSYFAARALRYTSDLAPVLEHLNDPAWFDVILFYAGLGDAAPLMDALVAREDYAFAGFVIAQAKDTAKETRDAVTAELTERAWAGDARALAALAEMHNEVAVDYYAARLKEKDVAVRARAAEILGQLQLDRGIDYLLPQLRDVNRDVRDKVVAALGNARTDRVIEPLLVALRGDPRVGTVDTRLRVAAARALGQTASEKAFAALIVDLQLGEPEVREVAAESLKQIKTPLMLKPLRSILETGDALAQKYAHEVLLVVDGEKK